MNTPDKKPGQDQHKQQGDQEKGRQQQSQHPADKGKTHDTTRDPQHGEKNETGYPPVNDPTGGPRRDEHRR
jgi:hypothetical protein